MVALSDKTRPRFSLGRTVITPGALNAFSRTTENSAHFLTRHVTGDWGTVSVDDAKENELSVQQGFRILSAYRLTDNTRIWIITEADRSSTCILLPEEY